MADDLTAEQRHKSMTHIRSKDTKIEVKLRKALWAEGFRYRKNVKSLPGKPDIVLPKYRIAIFCDSEYWHGKDWDELKPRLERGEHAQYWVPKIERNRERDEQVNQQLATLGWTVLRFWGKDITKNLDECVQTVKEAAFDAQMNEMDD